MKTTNRKQIAFRILSIIAGFAMIAILLVGDLLAVLSDMKDRDVAFEYSSADVEINLRVSVEGLSEGDTVAVKPNQPLNLSVSVEAEGQKESYLILEFYVPVIAPETSGETDDVDLFAFDIYDGWFYIDESTETVDDGAAGAGAGSNTYHKFVYGYKGDNTVDTLSTISFPDETGEVVREAKFYDFTHAFDWNGRMTIKAYAVQSEGYESETPAAVWNAVVRMY